MSRVPAIALLAAALVAGCTMPSPGERAIEVVRGPAPLRSTTPMTPALA